MSIHDWTRVPSGLFHHFHQDWSIEIARCLNRGLLPPGVSALVEQRAGAREPDVLSIESWSGLSNRRGGLAGDIEGGVVTKEAPTAQIVYRSTEEIYAARANRIAIRHHLGQIIAIIELVSPGNKDKRGAVIDFVEKAVDFIRSGVHVLIVDLFPPTPRDPKGLHKLIWDEIHDEAFEFPAGQDRLLASYQAGREKVAYLEPLGVGDPMPAMPLFLTTDVHIKVPLEATYQTAWEALPGELQSAVTTGKMPPAGMSRETQRQLLKATEKNLDKVVAATQHIRPIRHWNDDRIRAHVFACMLA